MASFVFENNNDNFDPDVKIKVIGVGGGGGNALNCMVGSDVEDIEYISINTDARALRNSKASNRIQIGAKLTKGRGAGNKPTVGKESAEENRDEIADAIKDADMIFITAGMGGGTGTGAAPIVAQIAQELNILTVAVVTKPFNFEREAKMKQAEMGIAELKKYVDSLIVIPNEKLLVGMEKPLTMKESFALADDILKVGVKSISDLIVDDGFINLDFADVSTIMKGAGYAHMAIGHGSGKDKATEAAKAVISSPLLETSISGAKRLLINIVMSDDVMASDVDTATKMITDSASDDVECIFGTAFKEDMNDEMTITVIAAGFENIGSAFASDDTPSSTKVESYSSIPTSGSVQPQSTQNTDDDLLTPPQILNKNTNKNTTNTSPVPPSVPIEEPINIKPVSVQEEDEDLIAIMKLLDKN